MYMMFKGVGVGELLRGQNAYWTTREALHGRLAFDMQSGRPARADREFREREGPAVHFKPISRQSPVDPSYRPYQEPGSRPVHASEPVFGTANNPAIVATGFCGESTY